MSRETNHNIKSIYTASNHNWKLFVDGEDKGSIIGQTDYDTDISEIHISGKSATYSGNGIYFNDIIVRKYTSPEPTVTVKCISDLNGDTRITPADAAITLQLAATGGWDSAADVNRDSRITTLDALMILRAADETITL
ncbi:MAG: hypothetical protein EF813_08060 [Methanosarcinales archaeon]|nr:MAG: hypothetical protein EF813_08060 [Methanosarcinales archaeon]